METLVTHCCLDDAGMIQISDILNILNNNVIGEFINFHIVVRLVEKCENFRFA